MKKIAALFFALSLISCLLFALPLNASAASSQTQDGLNITITTDNTEYTADESIQVAVNIKNTNAYKVENVSIETEIPDGLTIKSGSLSVTDISIEAGKTYSATAVLQLSHEPEDNETETTPEDTTEPEETTKPDDPDTTLPETCDDANIALWVVLLVISGGGAIIVLAVKNKKAAMKMLSLLLCLAMLSTMLPLGALAAESDSTSITVDKTIAVDGKEYNIKSLVTISKKTDITVSLHSSQTEYSINDDGTIYFYAEVIGNATSVVLIDEATGEAVLELLDDGQFSISGDDLPGDNIYSGIMVIDTSAEMICGYYAMANDNSELITNTVQVSVVGGFTDEQLVAMETVDLMIQEDIFSAEGYDEMSLEERISLAETVLEHLVEQELVEEDTVLYDESASTYTFLYESGVIGAVVLKDWAANFDGVDNLQNDSDSPNSDDLTETIAEDSDDNPQKDDDIRSSVDSIETATGNNNVAVPSGTTPHLGEAIVLWSFEQAWDTPSFRIPFYQQLESSFDAAGLETTVDWDVTVDDYKKLEDYEVIMLSGHGSYTKYTVKTGLFSKEKQVLPSLLLFEKSTKKKDDNYDSDLKAFRVGKISVIGGTMYAILPNFFTYYYDSGDLSGSFVFIQDCESHGKDGNENFLFSNALRAASAEAVVGYHNSVESNYGRNLMQTYVENLIAGNTAIDSFNSAVNAHGATDGYIAYPLFRGNANAVLVNAGIQNGDFEEASTAVHWDQIGDTRILTQLGSLTPPSNGRMAILTTGIGSAEKDYLAGTEGSVLSQSFRISEKTNTLVFSYDIVSEEPSEYVGSEYNDTFVVKLTVGSEVYTLITEDINNSTWYQIEGIDFEGGDSTTYHTMWQSVSLDVSNFAGQIVTLEFIVYDVGDSIYDTAALIDNIFFK